MMLYTDQVLGACIVVDKLSEHGEEFCDNNRDCVAASPCPRSTYVQIYF